MLPWLGDHAGLCALVLAVAYVSVRLHRTGITWGDDWTLYLRQAESLNEGNIADVIADNRYNVDNAAQPGFSPYLYPWGFPLLLAPFARLFGDDWARLKLVGVVALCLFLCCFYAVIRRRIHPWAALGVVALIGTSFTYLRYTGYLLSEYPYMASAAATLWYLDRVRADGRRLHQATTRELVVLGLAAVWVFNIRREGIALIGAIVVAQATDLWGVTSLRTLPWRRMVIPVATFVAGVTGFQLLLPTALVPEYDVSGLHQTWSKLGGPFRDAFVEQLGFDWLRREKLLVLFLVVMAGVVVRAVRAPRADLPLIVFAGGSMIAVGTIPAIADRYLLAVTPFAVYFAAQAVAAIPLPRRAGTWAAVAGLTFVSAVHLTKLPGAIDEVQRRNDAGIVVEGPATASAQEAFDAVRTYTRQDDVVAFFKARAMTYFTGRRAIQSNRLLVVRERADFSLIRRGSTLSQALVSDEDARAMGWVKVWENNDWILWQLPVYVPV